MLFNQDQTRKYVNVWLAICLILSILMISVGAYTRLTGSGLSIVEWNPITGVNLPYTEEKWQNEFEKYQTFPEYQKVNFKMKLKEFKFIFVIEFTHRMLGRIIWVTYFFPFLYFYLKNRIKLQEIYIYTFLLLLLSIQGLIGWVMVKSGLKSLPVINHFILSIHLIVGVFYYSIIFWQLLKNLDVSLAKANAIKSKISLLNYKLWCVLIIILIYIQVFLGGLVAGLDGKLIYNTFPLMGDHFIPVEFTWNKINLKNAACVQFLHRANAYFLVLVIVIFAGMLKKLRSIKLIKVISFIVLLLISQIIIGVLIIFYPNTLLIAMIHQIMAVILLSSVLYCYYLLKIESI